MLQNPFRLGTIAEGPFFADREREVRRVVEMLGQPAARLLVLGDRRLGKTSILQRALAQHRERGGAAVLVDLATVTSSADVVTRLLRGAHEQLGRSWRSLATDIASRLRLSVTLERQASGELAPALEVGARDRSPEEQVGAIEDTLLALNARAIAVGTPFAVVLDEFQTVRRVLGDAGEWQLRAAFQQCTALSVIVCGSEPSILRAMTSRHAPFYHMFETLEVGPIDAPFLSAWIDARLATVGIVSEGAGEACVALAGPRTSDVMRLARRVADVADTRGVATVDLVRGARDEIVSELDAQFTARWSACSVAQQRVLWAATEHTTGFTTEVLRRTFALGRSDVVSKALKKFVAEGILHQSHPATYVFDDPFFRAWVAQRAAGDLGRTD